ncbi:MAG: sigma-70 family RNA polymerase sigma factor [Ornithinimicrobium sp.]|uniref:sigma-70 family RNA polymerase sigma factor n=1 Tax=Ornithinimicrobium sp. TaxID=1977084 RepID=UPI003D9B8857
MSTRSTDATPRAPRESLILDHLDLADNLAQRFRGRGEPVEDLVQVARLGLVLASRRYDESSGVPFIGYAVPTVLGELRRHFRDHVWVVRPPRRLQELRPRVVTGHERLSHQMGRSPTATEMAIDLGVPEGDVIEALCLGTAYAPVPLEGSREDRVGAPAETLVAPDSRIEEVDTRLSLRPVLSGLPDRSRTVLRLHYFEDQSQQQLAGHLGVSQMQVSRILRSTLSRVREALTPTG